jgi:methionine-rich copper-binding protein CopC
MRAWSDCHIGALCAIAILLALPASASAHAGLISSTPGDDAVVAESPRELVLSFSEPVITGAGSVEVLDGVARPVPIGRLTQDEGGNLVVPLERTLERGSYTVVWKVISRDQDPVDGVFVFHVSTRGAAALAPAAAGDGGEGTAARITRVASYVLLGLWVAGAVALVFVARRRRRRLVGALVVAAAALAAMPLIRDAVDPGTGAAQAQTAFRPRVLLGDLEGRLAVTPARAGGNRIALTLPKPTAASGGYSEVRVRATLADAGKDLALAAVRGADPRAFTVRRAYLPAPGNWTLRISARRGSERYVATVALPVR